MSKINNVSDVFREAKKHLWDGKGTYLGTGNEFICHAIDDACYNCHSNVELFIQAKEIIQTRLGYNRGGERTVTDYLHEVLNLDYEELTYKRVQKYHKDWLTALEKEFKPKKGFAIHHMGDKNNNDLSNLTYVKLK